MVQRNLIEVSLGTLTYWLRPMAMTLAVLATAFTLCALACSSEEVQKVTKDTGSVRGHIIEVEAASILKLSRLTLRDNDGMTWTFPGTGYRGFTPSHLREHMLQSMPVTIVFHIDNNVHIIDEISD